VTSPPSPTPDSPLSPRPDDDPLIDPNLLDLLLRASVPIPVNTLARRLDTDTPNILDKLNQLRTSGCQIQTHPQHGVHLVQTSLSVWADYLHWRDSNQRLIEVYRSTTSTQDIARRLVESLGPQANRAVVIADEQTAGRGRLGRGWFTPPDTAVTFSRVCLSVANVPDTPDLSIDRLTLACAVAVAKTIEQLTGPDPLPVQIKWPNDLMIHGRKIAGILVETFLAPDAPHTAAAIIGIGINVDLMPDHIPPDLPRLAKTITSLKMLNRPADRLLVLAKTLGQLDQALAQPDYDSLLNDWRTRCPMISKPVRLKHNGQIIQGHLIDLHPTAGLIVRTDTAALIHLPAATTTIL